MCFRKAGGRRKELKIEVERKEIERVKKFKYIGYELREDNKENDHIKIIKGNGDGKIRWEKS